MLRGWEGQEARMDTSGGEDGDDDNSNDDSSLLITDMPALC